jgi:hypothetical protein
MDIIIDVAFVLTITAFLKTQLGLKGYAVILVAFLVSLVFGFAPLLATMIPAAGPYLKIFLDIVLVFMAAAGTYDTVRDFQTKQKK